MSNPGAWPADIAITATPESLNEAKTIEEVFKLAFKEQVNVLDGNLDKFSQWRVLRITAWIARFLHNARSQNQKKWPLTTENIFSAERRAEQEGTESNHFRQDCLQLNLQQNNQQLLACRGRIQGVYLVYLPDIRVGTMKSLFRRPTKLRYSVVWV